MTMANMNLIGVFVTKLWPVQALVFREYNNPNSMGKKYRINSSP